MSIKRVMEPFLLFDETSFQTIKTMKDENYEFAKDYAMEKINELKTWIPDIQKEANAWCRLSSSPKLLKV